MIYQRGKQTIDVGDNETTRQRILDRSGWKRVESPPVQPAEVAPVVKPIAPTGLPDDFPARTALVEAGYTSINDVLLTDNDVLMAIKGVSKATIGKIRGYTTERG
jgi:hypothetical protein